MKSKIKFIEKSNPRSYESRYGTMYAMHCVLEDGTDGEVSAKSVDKWNIGDEVEYTVTSSQYGNKLSLTKPNDGGGYSAGGGSKPKYDDKQRDAAVVVSYAKDLAVAGKISLAEIEDYAEKFNGIIQRVKEKL